MAGMLESGSERVSAALVGRELLLALAGRRWEQAAGGVGQLLLFAGEAGIGKTRMMSELASTLPDARVLTAAAWPSSSEVAGSMLLELARDLRRHGLDGAAAALQARLTSEDVTGDATRRRRLLVTDTAELIAELLPGTLLRWEDLHWADEISLEVIERLAVLVRDAPGMIAATYRSDEMFSGTPLARWRARLLEQRLAEEVRLPRLPRESTAVLAEELLGRVPSSDFVDVLQERSEGIPLYIEELIADGASQSVPDTVSEAVRSRMEQLSPESRELAFAASVIGSGFSLDLLMAVVPDDAETADRALVELQDRHLLIGDGERVDFDFRHALIRDAVYEQLPPNRRRLLHAAVARAAEAAGMREAYLSEQFERAHLPANAHRHALTAAENARVASAHREAAALFSRALRTAPAATDQTTIAYLHSRTGIELAAIDDNEGAAHHFEEAIRRYRELGDAAAAADHVSNLMSARHSTGDGLARNVARAVEALAWLDELPDGGPRTVRAGLYSALAAAYMLDRRLDEALGFGERAAALAVDPEAHCDRLDIAMTLGPVLAFAGRSDEAWRMLEGAIAEASAPGTDFEVEAARGYRMIGSSSSVLVEYELAERWITQGLAVTTATERWNDHHYLRAHLAHVLWATGRLDDAEHEARRALADGRDVTTEITARHVLGYLAIARDNAAEALAQLDRARELGSQMNELQRIAPALWGLAELAVLDGRFDDAVRLTDEGFARCAEVSDAAYLFPFVVTGTRARLGPRDRGSAGVAAARDWLDRTGRLLGIRRIPGTMPALVHAEGLIALAEGRTVQAREYFDRALLGWTERGRFWERTQLLVDLARCAQRARRPGEASRFVAEARRVGDTSGAVALVRIAEQLGVDAEASTESGPLTTREFEVARLVAEGATNREIAERLVISPKTVSTHVEHILAKLQVARRAEIASWVSRVELPV
ncbi:MAG TPA: LuxR C-terminal-related transcriptional regulator [Pseudolysinimonas sp.]|jgi:DNA-binding CsgD family transcriptional regulator/tetratricopeptide (TPR) repeat protein